jgi:O-acetyl-ADP-ribose deacetylase (regulator of RNase III)
MEIKYAVWLNLTLKKGDITEAKVDGIANDSNSGLQHGDGIAGALLKKCGP